MIIPFNNIADTTLEGAGAVKMKENKTYIIGNFENTILIGFESIHCYTIRWRVYHLKV